MDNHFGLLTLNLSSPTPHIVAEIWDIRDNQRVEHTIALEEIRFPDTIKQLHMRLQARGFIFRVGMHTTN